MLTHMLIQYLVGLCCLRGNPSAVNVELGDMVLDESVGKRRDVDVTVTANDDDGGEKWVFKAFEVKDEGTPLDVTEVEQLCIKLKDMPSITHRGIVSSSGFSDGAKRKAEHHKVDLYSLEQWSTSIELEFPKFGLRGLPEYAISFSRQLLVWLNEQVYVTAPAARRPFDIKSEDALLDSTGALHSRYTAFHQYRHDILLRSTERLYAREPAQTMMRTLPSYHSGGLAVTSEWPHTHTLDVSADDVYFEAGDLVKIEEVTISGFLRWETLLERPDFRVMRRVSDGEAFAGALIALGQREGEMFAFVVADSPTAGVHFVKLERKHLNMIRQLSLDLPAVPEPPG